MRPSLGRIVHATDHATPELPPLAAVIARIRQRETGDRPAPDRGRDTVFPEDSYVVDLCVFAVTGIFSIFDVEFAADPTVMGQGEGKTMPYHEWSWSWPERV